MGVGPPLSGTRLAVELLGWAALLCLTPAGLLCSSGFTSHAHCLLRGVCSFPACPSRPPPDQPGLLEEGLSPVTGHLLGPLFLIQCQRNSKSNSVQVSLGGPPARLSGQERKRWPHCPHGY